MTSELTFFFQQYVHLPADELDDITSKFTHKIIKKNEFVLQEGEVCKDIIFVQ